MINYDHGPSNKNTNNNGNKDNKLSDAYVYSPEEIKADRKRKKEAELKRKMVELEMINALNNKEEIEDELVVEVLIHVFRVISNQWNYFIQYNSKPFIRDDDDKEYDQSKNEEGKMIKWWTQWNLNKKLKNGMSLRDMIINDFKERYADELNTEGGKRRKTSRRTRKPRRKSSRRLRRKSRRQRKR